MSFRWVYGGGGGVSECFCVCEVVGGGVGVGVDAWGVGKVCEWWLWWWVVAWWVLLVGVGDVAAWEADAPMSRR